MARSLLLDSNLLVLLIVGSVDVRYVTNHRRTRDFTQEDFGVLTAIIDQFDELWVTTHIYAEASNHLRQTNTNLSKILIMQLAQLSKATRESAIPLANLADNAFTVSLGVTDAGIIQKAKRVSRVLTTDLPLYLELTKRSGNAINFNHIRTGAWNLNDLGA
jgi:hypothetical protein